MRGHGDRGPFVGRQPELQRLSERLQEAATGKGDVVLVSGEPGVGKTRLVQELAARAAKSGYTVLFGRAYDTDIVPPYGPIAEALGGYVESLPETEIRRQLGERAADVALLLPDLLSRLPGLTPRPATGLGEDRYRLFECVSAFLLAAARSSAAGLVLILDDLQWADRPTVQLMVHLARKLAVAPLLLVATYRRDELNPDSPLVDAFAELSREGLSGRLQLGRLSATETAALANEMWGQAVPPAAMEALYRRTDGS